MLSMKTEQLDRKIVVLKLQSEQIALVFQE